MKTTKVICGLILTIISQEVLSEGFDYKVHIEKYMKCEAVQNVAANILSQSEQEFYQHELHNASLDSRIVALELARAGNYNEELVDELYNTYLTEYRKSLSESEGVEKFINSLRLQVDRCKQLNAMQEDIVRRKKQQRDQ